MNEFIDAKDLSEALVNGRALLDVRSEQEFLDGAVPGACNFPILNNSERAQVGTTYKHQGQTTAIELGHQLVSGPIRATRIVDWIRFVNEAKPVGLYCARGGLRSEISYQWIRDAGVTLPRVRGGYKALRNFLLTELERICASAQFVLLGGRTGVGKTRIIEALRDQCAIVDLEYCALHRGSTFGKVFGEQPTQGMFENRLIVELMRATRRGGAIVLEAESRRIGRDTIPEPLWRVMEQCPVVVLEESFEYRVQQILEDYVRFLSDKFLKENADDAFDALERFLSEAVRKNDKRLGSERTAQTLQAIAAAIAEQRITGSLELHRTWIARMLSEYYDPFYDKHGEDYRERVIARGNAAELRTLLPSLLFQSLLAPKMV